jgi:hypothetical protein
MALVAPPIRFSRGSLDDVSFYTDSRGRHLARMKRVPNMDFHTHPKLARCRENASEFGGNARIAGRIRKNFNEHAVLFSEGTYFNRLMGLLQMISRMDTQNQRGSRNCLNGNIHLLSGFQFNKDVHLEQAFDVDYTTHIDTATGNMTVNFDSFVPLKAVTAPAGARYFQLLVRGCSLSPSPNGINAVTNLLPISSKEVEAFSLSVPVAVTEEDLLLLGVGIVFYEEHMGVPLPLRGGAMTIAEVARVGAEAHAPKPDTLKSMDRTAWEQVLKEFDGNRGAWTIPSVLTGINNSAPAGDLAEKQFALMKHRWLEKLRKYRNG